jgi:hypothetical protein
MLLDYRETKVHKAPYDLLFLLHLYPCIQQLKRSMLVFIILAHFVFELVHETFKIFFTITTQISIVK